MVSVADVVLVLHPHAYRAMTKSATGLVGKHIEKIGEAVRIATEVEAPRKGGIPRNRTGINYATGELARSIKMTVNADGVSDVEAIVSVGVEHAKFVIGGTRPHMIFPKTPGKKLRFFWHRMGKIVYFPFVHHPGTIANDFMSRGLKKGCALFGMH